MSSRDRAFLAQCPTCGAPPFSRCLGKRGKRKSVHKARMTAEVDAEALSTTKNPDEFFASQEWLRLRYDALKANGARCQCCGARPTRERPLHVDHIKPRAKYPELALDISNLQVLCADCNLGKGARDSTDWRSK